MLRHVLTGLVLLIAIPMQLKAADGPSPGLARTVEQVFDPDTGTANAVGEVTKVAAVSGLPVYQVIAVMGAQVGSRDLARVGVTAQVGTTIINNFAPTQPSRGLATTTGTGTESEDSFSVSNTSGTKSGGVGKSGVINGGGNGGAQFVAAGSDGVGVGSNNPGDTSVAVTESLQAYTQSFLDGLSGFKASDFSNFAANFAGVTAKFEPSASTFKSIQSQRAAEPSSGFSGPSLGSGFLDAAKKPQQVAALSPAQKDPVPSDRLAFNQVFLPTPPSPTTTPTTTPTTPSTAVAAKPVEPAKPTATTKPPATSKPDDPTNPPVVSGDPKPKPPGLPNVLPNTTAKAFKVCIMPLNCAGLVRAFNGLIKDCKIDTMNFTLATYLSGKNYNCGGAPGQKEEIDNCIQQVNASCKKDLLVKANEKATSISITFLTDLYKDALVSWTADMNRTGKDVVHSNQAPPSPPSEVTKPPSSD